jgi:hypothetical protein
MELMTKIRTIRDLSFAITISLSSIALAQPADQLPGHGKGWLVNDNMPPGTGYKSDGQGKITGCVPPVGAQADQAFKDNCKNVVRDNKLARRITPLHAQDWISSPTLTNIYSNSHPSHPIAFKLTVDGEATVTDCEILSSSGNPQVDQAVCGLLLKNARFIAGRNGDGSAMIASYTNVIRWPT